MGIEAEDKSSDGGDKGETDYLNMSDADFENLGETELLPPGDVEKDATGDEDKSDDDDSDKDDADNDKDDKNEDKDSDDDNDDSDDDKKDKDDEKSPLADPDKDEDNEDGRSHSQDSDKEDGSSSKSGDGGDGVRSEEKGEELSQSELEERYKLSSVDKEGNELSSEERDEQIGKERNKRIAEFEKRDKQQEKGEIDYKTAYENMLSPLKANGKTMNIDSIDDMRKLAQMGANYNKKMAAMKPSMKILKMLEKNDLLEEGKLNFLIDLHKQDPDAIKKLLRDSKIDTDTLSMDDEIKYKPTQHGVGDNEVELDAAIEAIKDTPSYSKTLKVVGSDWDDKSKQIVADNPDLIRVINDQIANGIFDKISNEVEKERVFGRLGDISDIEAYRQIGEAMEKKGEFKQDEKGDPADEDSPEKKEAATKKKADDEKRRAKRQALQDNKKLPEKKSKRDKDFNPLSLSDEDYLKEFDASLL